MLKIGQIEFELVPELTAASLKEIDRIVDRELGRGQQLQNIRLARRLFREVFAEVKTPWDLYVEKQIREAGEKQIKPGVAGEYNSQEVESD